MNQSIRQFFEQDHDRLDELFRRFQTLKHSDFYRAKEAFVQFHFGLQRHITWEEKILFPLFERRTGMSPTMGPTAVMRLEHGRIREYLDGIYRKVEQTNPHTDEEENGLLKVLGLHNDKEELILYPAMDQHMTDADRDEVFSAIRAIPDEQYAGAAVTV